MRIDASHVDVRVTTRNEAGEIVPVLNECLAKGTDDKFSLHYWSERIKGEHSGRYIYSLTWISNESLEPVAGQTQPGPQE